MSCTISKESHSQDRILFFIQTISNHCKDFQSTLISINLSMTNALSRHASLKIFRRASHRIVSRLSLCLRVTRLKYIMTLFPPARLLFINISSHKTSAHLSRQFERNPPPAHSIIETLNLILHILKRLNRDIKPITTSSTYLSTDLFLQIISPLSTNNFIETIFIELLIQVSFITTTIILLRTESFQFSNAKLPTYTEPLIFKQIWNKFWM